MTYDPKDPKTWVKHAAFDTKIEVIPTTTYNGINLQVKDVPPHERSILDICGKGRIVNIPWRTLRFDGEFSILDKEELESYKFEVKKNLENYWNLDELCEVDLAIVGRW